MNPGKSKHSSGKKSSRFPLRIPFRSDIVSKKEGFAMERRDNYLTQVRQAKRHFLSYDFQTLASKPGLQGDREYLRAVLLGRQYRIRRCDGAVQRLDGESWQDTEDHGEVMTLLDLVCDSRPDRYLSGRWKQMTAFGLLFHQELLEQPADAFLRRCDRDPQALKRACTALGGKPMEGGDVSFAIELFDGLAVWLQFWEGDEEFPSRLRWLWDENALMYLKYETMYFALGLLKRRILEVIEEEST